MFKLYPQDLGVSAHPTVTEASEPVTWCVCRLRHSILWWKQNASQCRSHLAL